MIPQHPRSTVTDTLFPTRRSSDLPASPKLAKKRTLYRDQLQRYSRELAGERAVRPRAGRVHRSACAAKGSYRNRIRRNPVPRSEEHTSEIQSLMSNSYAVFCLNKKKKLISNVLLHNQTN